MNGTPTQQVSLAAGQPWNPPWSADATKDATLSALRSAYPKNTVFGASLHYGMAFALVRGQAGFVAGTTALLDNEADNLAYVRGNWSRF